MNKVDYLLRVQFSTLSLEEKLEMKRKQQRLNALSMLSIENPLVHGLVDFNSKVIERFAQAKNHRANFLFK